MRVASFLVILMISLYWSSSAQSADLDGQWLGYEPRSSLSPDEKDTKWFFENRLTIAKGVIRLEKTPGMAKAKTKSLRVFGIGRRLSRVRGAS